MSQECDTLHCLPEPHLICKDPIDPLVIEVGQPVHAFQLVGLEHTLEHGRLWKLPVRDEHGCCQTELLVNFREEGKEREEGGRREKGGRERKRRKKEGEDN